MRKLSNGLLWTGVHIIISYLFLDFDTLWIFGIFIQLMLQFFLLTRTCYNIFSIKILKWAPAVCLIAKV